jgi:hypothetical protein
MDANLAQVIIAIIVALGGILTAKISKREAVNPNNNNDEIIFLLKQENDALKTELEKCRSESERNKSDYFEVLTALHEKRISSAKRRGDKKTPPGKWGVFFSPPWYHNHKTAKSCVTKGLQKRPACHDTGGATRRRMLFAE